MKRKPVPIAVVVARARRIGALVEQAAAGEITMDDLYREVFAMGYSTRLLRSMVEALRQEQHRR